MVALVQSLLYLGFAPNVDFATSAASASLRIIDRWMSALPQPTPAEIAAAMLPATKAFRIEADRLECRRRLTEHYGDALEQVSRASGVYGVVAKANHAAGVDATIDATNVARDQINAATTIAQVEAVTVNWPALT